ncbi:MAG TPA: hypothetical protein VFD49_13265 [Candidatus Dormibacteraeota bacterium]|nr:hypothetical protein [Candidatus Dormibacteraeota bacterium]
MNQDRHRPADSEPVIDEGFRAWYRTCPCCLGDAYPEVRRALEREELLEAARRAAET